MCKGFSKRHDTERLVATVPSVKIVKIIFFIMFHKKSLIASLKKVNGIYISILIICDSEIVFVFLKICISNSNRTSHKKRGTKIIGEKTRV